MVCLLFRTLHSKLFYVIVTIDDRARNHLRNSIVTIRASVSVIVPAYNEEPQILKNCIDSIVAQKST